MGPISSSGVPSSHPAPSDIFRRLRSQRLASAPDAVGMIPAAGEACYLYWLHHVYQSLPLSLKSSRAKPVRSAENLREIVLMYLLYMEPILGQGSQHQDFRLIMNGLKLRFGFGDSYLQHDRDRHAPSLVVQEVRKYQ